jgi:hypothetical protein
MGKAADLVEEAVHETLTYYGYQPHLSETEPSHD